MEEAAMILWNPRMPDTERKRIEGLFSTLPRLKGHFWISTSGSSGLAKWVALSEDAILAAAEGANRHIQSDSKDVWLKAIPGFHVGGLGILFRARLSGAKVVELETKWDPREFARSAEESASTLSALVPAQVYDIVQAGIRSPSKLRAIIVGGGALAEGLYFRARELGWKLLPSYGLSECASQVATASLDSLNLDRYPDLVLLPHIDARTRGGKIEIRSPALLAGYALERDSGMEFVDPKKDGWFITEDRGKVDGRNLLPLGREGAFVKMGGESVDFSRLEKLFEEARLEAGFLGEAVLFAAPDSRMGHLTHLAVSGLARDSIEINRLREIFDRKVLPVERIRIVHAIDEIPKSALGKTLKAELRKKLGL